MISVLSNKEAQQIIDQKFEYDQILSFSGKSKSQLRQDVFVLSSLGFKRNGYFVEFGATNGLDLSNTYLLESEFGWSGIVAEPLPTRYTDLIHNRRCHIEDKCVWSVSNLTLQFNQTEISDLSTIHIFSDSDGHSDYRKNSKLINVSSISLLDLLDKYNAPRLIDYLSIDTEGSEFEILRNFNFTKYKFKVITCEHNYTNNRDHIYNLLTNIGYKRVFENISQFDDWYLLSS